MNVRIAHMAHITIGLTSHAFIIDAVVAAVRYIVTRDVILCENQRENSSAIPFVKRLPCDFYVRNAGNCGKVADRRMTFLNVQDADRTLVFYSTMK